MHAHKTLKAFIATTMVAISGHAALVMQHSGTTDPLNEGWVRRDNNGPAQGDITVGSITDNGTPAWFVNDSSTVVNSIYQYIHSLSSGDVTDAIGNGWSMNISLRVVDVPDAVDASIYSRVNYNNTSFMLTFGSQADGDPIVRLGGSEYVLEGTGGGYHDYSLVYDETQASVDLFVDGSEVLSNFAGDSVVLAPEIGWGGASSFSTGNANYNSVTFAIPEPSSALLIGVGGIFLVRNRKCRVQLQRSLFRLTHG